MLVGCLARASSLVRSSTVTRSVQKKPYRMTSQTQGPKTLVPIVLAGPSAVGKGTLINMLKKDFPAKVGHSVSHTTRAPREGEENGVSYHFVTPDHFQELVDQGKFVETAKVHTNRYGTTFDAVSAVVSRGQVCLLDLDVQGCQSVRRVGFKAYMIFIRPPSMDELEKRLRHRAAEKSEEEVQIRLQTARNEMNFVEDPMWDKVIVNDNLDDCYAQLKTLINEANHNVLTD